ncbi:hypothetical protein F8A87_08220 [Betaproteobacteria bacterium SCN2]|jgi:hypothetical protein|nr:hypothetical protein F8A87_08220 [Betaproteobacteria bacterium SCN2]
MNIINATEMSLERMHSIFQSKGCQTEIVETLPADPDLGLSRDAYLHVDFPQHLPVVVWLDSHADHQIRMRVIVADREHRDQMGETELMNFAADCNQQIQYFGSLSPRNSLGITLEYRLPYNQGILENTIFRAAEEMSFGGWYARKHISTLDVEKNIRS